jgi:hypothetical protein
MPHSKPEFFCLGRVAATNMDKGDAITPPPLLPGQRMQDRQFGVMHGVVAAHLLRHNDRIPVHLQRCDFRVRGRLRIRVRTPWYSSMFKASRSRRGALPVIGSPDPGIPVVTTRRDMASINNPAAQNCDLFTEGQRGVRRSRPENSAKHHWQKSQSSPPRW